MRFKVRRTSCWMDEKPCDNCTTEEKTHTRHDGSIYTEVKYFVEINTLEELLGFINLHGRIVLSTLEREIEIYDDYRE